MSSTQGLMIISKAGEGSGSRAVKFKLLPALGHALLSSPSQCSTALLGEVRLALAPAPLPDSICCPWESLCLIHANPSPGLHEPNSAAPGAPLGPALSPLLAPHGLRVSLCLGICLNLTQKCSGTTSVPAVPLASSGVPTGLLCSGRAAGEEQELVHTGLWGDRMEEMPMGILPPKFPKG